MDLIIKDLMTCLNSVCSDLEAHCSARTALKFPHHCVCLLKGEGQWRRDADQ